MVQCLHPHSSPAQSWSVCLDARRRMVCWMVALWQAGVSVSFKSHQVLPFRQCISCVQIMFIFTMFLYVWVSVCVRVHECVRACVHAVCWKLWSVSQSWFWVKLHCELLLIMEKNPLQSWTRLNLNPRNDTATTRGRLSMFVCFYLLFVLIFFLALSINSAFKRYKAM